uniref:Uncharacterized protein n=1 Tax=Arundo donax TaxID=35708 RepID=A0A0A9A4T9_ARUDO
MLYAIVRLSMVYLACRIYARLSFKAFILVDT